MPSLRHTYYAARLLGRRGVWRHFSRRLGSAPPESVRQSLHELCGKQGLELGGPSDVFRPGGSVPIYSVVAGLDGCNFSNETMWQGKLQPGGPYVYRPDRPAGKLYIADAVSLGAIESDRYDFVASSHVLEHVANPLRAIRAQLRVTRPGGVLLIVLPHRAATFDRRREVTRLEHLLEDDDRNVDESDATHVEEFLDRVDLGVIAFPGGMPVRAARARDNAAHRVVHHHVFDERLAEQMLAQCAVGLLCIDVLWPFHIVALARKSTHTAASVTG
jgi:SAM-dependent methyltransferase